MPQFARAFTADMVYDYAISHYRIDSSEFISQALALAD
jgi:hypothetical protein